mmetsp:Transcript_14385/g.45354  ORF Transcript_14385/g.45354 Transcript_14385/m.45354 type:complete len:185 (+) Transcript_14385:43-597(+)
MARSVAMVVVGLLAAEALVPQPAQPAQPKMTEMKKKAIAKSVSQAALSAALAGTLLLSPVDAFAARSGGRAGGSSFRSRPAPTRSYSRTTVRSYAAPVPVPVPVSPFGYGGFGYGYGGGINTGTYLGLSLLDAIVEEQRRAAIMRQQLETQQQLGRDAGEIAALKAQLDAQDKRIAELQAQAGK